MSKLLKNEKTLEPYYTQEIFYLAKLLRKNGDRVLSGSSKLVLSSKLLYSLNKAFSLIIYDTNNFESSFQVCHSSRNEVNAIRE